MDPLNNPKYITILEKLGLNKHEAQIYELLIEEGALGVKPVLFNTKLKRGNAYYHLDNLKAKGLVETTTERGKTIFTAKHPEHLELLLAKQKAALAAAEENLSKTLPELRSLFQLATTKPGVKFYEGMEGALKVLNNSLTSQTPIYSFIDSEAVNKYFPEINQQYVKQRVKKEIKKKMITSDSAYVRQHAKEMDKSKTEIRVIPSPSPFSTVMQIYDNKISYLTLSGEKNIIAMIIEQPSIYNMHKNLFEIIWNIAKPVGQYSNSQ